METGFNPVDGLIQCVSELNEQLSIKDALIEEGRRIVEQREQEIDELKKELKQMQGNCDALSDSRDYWIHLCEKYQRAACRVAQDRCGEE